MAWTHINDNKAQRTNAFKKVSVLDRIVGWNLNHSICSGNRQSPCLYPLLMAQSIGDALVVKKESDLGYIYSVAIANCTAPGVRTKALNTANARALFMRNGIAFIHHCQTKPRFYGSMTAEQWAAEIPRVVGPAGHFIAPTPDLYNQISTPGFMESAQYTAIKDDLGNFFWVFHMLLYIVQYTTSPILINASSLIYIYTFVAFSKRGMITEAKAQKISQQMALEIDVNIDLDNYMIAEIYANLSSLINEENAQEIFAEWASNMKTFSLRMRITLEQVVGSGLTTYNAIRDSMRIFENFAWGEVFGLLPKDTDNFIKALSTIGGNNYYGFSQDLAAVGSSKYKSLGYVAKEMLRLYGGPEYASLSKAACWTKSPLRKAALDELIENYGARHDDRVIPKDAAFVQLIMRAVAASISLLHINDDEQDGPNQGDDEGGNGGDDNNPNDQDGAPEQPPAGDDPVVEGNPLDAID